MTPKAILEHCAEQGLQLPEDGQGESVVVGLSGGVDSAVAAWILKQRGYQVSAMFMKNWEDDDDDEYCSTREDLVDAAAAADVLGIEIDAINFAAEYRERVFADFLREYSAGRTPNPDILCNAEIKFRAFLDHAVQTGASLIATGHYARIGRDSDNNRYQLLRGLDTSKDQSYFLHRLSQEQLSRVLFPLGSLPKSTVRELAQAIGLGNAAKKDSTGICFIGERPFREFLNRYLPTKPGPIQTPDGRTLGEHVGLAFYTLGQRRGIGLGGDAHGSDDPWYVAKKDLENNRLIVVQGHDHPLLFSNELIADGAHWIAGVTPDAENISAQVRYRQAGQPGKLIAGDGYEFSLMFDAPQRAVTPGQSAVVYIDDVCLGGGFIDARLPQLQE
jgi:tRNA-specific 2-thiouridylase